MEEGSRENGGQELKTVSTGTSFEEFCRKEVEEWGQQLVEDMELGEDYFVF